MPPKHGVFATQPIKVIYLLRKLWKIQRKIKGKILNFMIPSPAVTHLHVFIVLLLISVFVINPLSRGR